MRSLACVVTLLTGCIWYSDPEVSLAELPALQLEFHISGPNGVRVELLFNDLETEVCSVLPPEVHAEFDGVPLTVDRGGGGTHEERFCEGPAFRTDEPRASGSHTFLLEDGSRTIALDLGENMLKRTLVTIPPGPFEFTGGQTYTFQTNVPKDLERGFTAAIHPNPSSYVGLTPIAGPDGTFTLTMPLQELGGTLDTKTYNAGRALVVIDGVGCYFPDDEHSVSTPVHVTAP